MPSGVSKAEGLDKISDNLKEVHPNVMTVVPRLLEKVYDKIIAEYIDGRPEHQWYTKGFDPKRLEEIKSYYKERYNQDVN